MGVAPQQKGALCPEIRQHLQNVEKVFANILKNPHVVVDFNQGAEWHHSGPHAAAHHTGHAIDIGLKVDQAFIPKLTDAISRGFGSKFRVQVQRNGNNAFLHVELMQAAEGATSSGSPRTFSAGTEQR